MQPLFYVGGLVGQHIKDPGSTAESKITRSFWNTQAYAAGETPASAMIKAVKGVGQSDSAIESSIQVTGLSAQQMRTASNFSNWNNTQIWLVYDGQAQPLLRAFMTPLYLKSSASGSKTYDGSVNFNTGNVQDPGNLTKLFAGKLSLVLNDPNAGYRQAVASGYYSDQWGYQIVYDFDVNKVLVEKATLIFTADKASFNIGQQINALSGQFSGLVGNEDLSKATTGVLNWQAPQDEMLKPGQFAIQASGLSSTNYKLVQDPTNQTALTIRAFETPSLITAATALHLQPLTYLQPLPIKTDDNKGKDAVASAAVTAKDSAGFGGIYEFCLPKPPSMLSLVSATCVRGKHP